MVDTSHITSKLTAEIELLERHILMLKITKQHQPIGIIRISELLGIPKHKVRYSLRILEKAGLIEATGEGAMVTDRYPDIMENMSKYLEELTDKIKMVNETIEAS